MRWAHFGKFSKLTLSDWNVRTKFKSNPFIYIFLRLSIYQIEINIIKKY